MNKLMRDYSLFEGYNIDLANCKIIDIFVAENMIGNSLFEGGLTIIFDNQKNQRGMIIFGYTELGEWIEYCRLGNDIVYDACRGYMRETDQSDFIERMISDYNIE